MKPTIFPVLRYKDAPAAIEWLCGALLFEKQVVFPAPDGTIAHAELRRDGGVIGISSATPPVSTNPWSSVLQGVYMTIDDVDAHHARAQSTGARIAIAQYDTHYGSREYSAWDVQGHLWGFGTYPMGSPSGEPGIFPELSYHHEPDAVAWLTRAFGLRAAVRIPGPDGRPLHVEMRHGDSTIMLNLGQAQASSDALPQAISLRADDPDALFANATKHRAAVVQAPATTHYGARAAWLRDPEGFLWGISTYRPKS